MAFFTKTSVFVVLLACLSVAYFKYDGFNADSIKGKRVVITGASTGIGEQIAYHFARFGAKVLVTARREAVLQQVVAKCKELGAAEAYYLPLDMANLDHTKHLIQEAKEKFNGLDYLILNHVTHDDNMQLWKGDMTILERIMKINFRAYVGLATEATTMLVESGGAITVVSSFAGKVGIPYTAAYSASKFALGGFFGSLRQEFIIRNENVSITLCTIGSINTTNAIKFSKHVFREEMFATSPADTAMAIIRATVTRQREVFFPFPIGPLTLIRDLIPETIDYLTRIQIKDEAPK